MQTIIKFEQNEKKIKIAAQTEKRKKKRPR